MKYTLSLALLLTSLHLFSANQLDSLYTLWQDHTKSDTVRIEAYSDYLWHKYMFNYPDSAFMGAEEMLAFSEKKEDLNGIGRALNFMGISHSIRGNYAAALGYFKRTLLIYQELDNKGQIANMYNNIGNIYFNQGNNREALNYYLKGLKTYEDAHDERGVSVAYLNIGLMHQEMDHHDEAFDYYGKSMKVAQKLQDKMQIAQLHFNIAGILMDQKKFDLAKERIEQNITLCKEINELNNLAKSYQQLGKLHYSIQEYDEAKRYYLLSLKQKEAIGDRNSITMTLLGIGELELKLKNFSQAQKACERALQISEEVDAIDNQASSCNCLYLIHKEMGNTAKALAFHEQKISLDDSLQIGETNLELQQMEFSMQVYADSIERAKVQHEQEELFQDEIDRKKRNQDIAIVSTLFVLLISGFIFNILRTKVKLAKSRSEKLQAISAFRSQMFANVSHEFRTPLSLIMGPIKEVIQRTDNKKDQQLLELALRNAEQLLDLVNQQLEVSSIEATSITPEIEPIDFNSVVSQVAWSFESLANEKSIDYTISIGEQDNRIFLDAEKLEIIVKNLLSNAFKFTSPGGLVSLSVGETKEHLTLVVTDTGIGIDPRDKERIFDRFYHKKGGDTKGSGIGLTLVREYATLLNGSVSLESSPGSGSIFTVRFSRKPQENGRTLDPFRKLPPTEEKEATPISQPSTSELLHADKPVALLVEDNADLAKFTKSILEQEYRVIVARDGEEGLQKAISDQPDIIISDLMMPKMDGLELLTALRQDKHSFLIPVVLLTAKASVESKIEGLDLGADGYLVKPFNAKELLATVGSILRQRTFVQKQIRETLGLLTQPKSQEIKPMEQTLLVKVMTYITEHFDSRTLGSESIASEIGLSPSHLNRKIKAIANRSVSKLIVDVRLEKAVDLIRSQNLNISEIADRTGFSSSAYFVKCFKDKYGVTPGKWQKEQP